MKLNILSYTSSISINIRTRPPYEYSLHESVTTSNLYSAEYVNNRLSVPRQASTLKLPHGCNECNICGSYTYVFT